MARRPPRTPHPTPLPTAQPVGVGEEVWIDVIRKMDEVYAELLQYEVALEEKNAALEDSQRFILSVLTSMSDILIVCGRSGGIEQVNGSLERLAGRPEAELRGAQVLELFADEPSRDLVRRLLATPAAASDREVRLRAADGSGAAVSLNCMPRQTAAGKRLGLVLTGRPVGELRRAYEALRRAHEDLQRTQQQLVHSEKMASLGRLVAGVAHELNNPISFVLGNVHALRRYAARLQTYVAACHAGRPADELARLRAELRIDRIVEDLQPLVEGTIEGAERTRDIVHGLKRFSAPDRDEDRPFDLVPVVERAVHWVAKGAPRKVRLEPQLDLPPAITVVGSAGQLQQVVMNLVQNACDATAGVPGPRLEIAGRIEGELAVLTFRDNGAGIPEKHLPLLFDPFFTTKPVGQGTGLGLAISYGIVERHRGTLAAANDPRGGAVFTLTLPVAR